MAGQKLAGEVLVQGLRLRAGPGTTFSILTTLNRGQVVDVLEQQGDWARVRSGTIEGFAATQFLNITTGESLAGFLIERPDLLEMDLQPDRFIPTDGLQGAELAVARTWNELGNLLSRLADLLRIPVSAVVAVLVAESSGRTFAADGRMIIRFENHVFFRLWGERNADLFNRHFRFDTSSPRNHWKGHQWRPSVESEWQAFHGTQSREWEVLTFARALDDTAALSSISMGAPQVMGFNFKRLGYESVQHMFDQFARSAHAQLLAMFDLVKGPGATSPAIQALQNRDYLTFASSYNGPANAETYRDIIQARADMFDRLITKAVARPRPDTTTRGPVETPVTPAPDAPVAPPTPPAPEPPPVVTTPPAPPANSAPVFIATANGLNVRREPVVQEGNIIERLRLNEPVTILEPLEQALEKMNAGEQGKLFIKVRTDEGREGFVAAWLVIPADDALVRRTVDAYIDSIPDYPIPAAYDALWALQDQIGLPDPFTSLPVQIRTRHKLVNMMVNGFGPNSFSARNWKRYYSRVGGMHNGHDFIIETGTPLLAVADGIITKRWPFMANPRDKTVTLWPFLPDRFRDANGRRMLSNVLVAYAHLSDNTVRDELATVKAGEVIGISGMPAGETSNDHLHMEVHLLDGDPSFLNLRQLAPRKLLPYYNRPQPFSNQRPWNPVLFYNRRLVRYIVHQSRTVGYFGGPSYPTPATLRAMGAGHLPALDEFTVAAFEYGIPVVWEKRAAPWPEGAVPLDQLPERLRGFRPFQPYPADFLKT